MYDVRKKGIQRSHDDTPGLCWEWAHASEKHTLAVHLSVGPPVWWKPNLGRKRYSGITEWRAGWLWIAIQVAHKKH